MSSGELPLQSMQDLEVYNDKPLVQEPQHCRHEASSDMIFERDASYDKAEKRD